MSRLRRRTFSMSTDTWPVVTPNSPARATILATPALQISFLLGRQLMLGQEPPTQRRSTTAVFRSEEHTSELQSLMRISYAVFCLKKKILTNLFPTISSH